MNGIPFRLTAVRLRQLQLFELAAVTGSISESARQLNISQPAATEMLKGLERAFSVQLFIGTSRGIVLTEKGKRVAARAAGALRELELANDEAESDIAVGEVIRVGLAHPAMYSNLPQAIYSFMQSNPRILINLREYSVQESVHALQDGEVDIVVTANDPTFSGAGARDQVVVQPLSLDHYQPFIGKFAKFDPDWAATPENMRSLSWILPIKESFVRRMLDDWFLSRGLSPPESYIELTPLTAAIEMLRIFPFAALLPSALSQNGNFGHLVPLAEDIMLLPIRLVVACKEVQFNRPAVMALVDEIVAACGGID